MKVPICTPAALRLLQEGSLCLSRMENAGVRVDVTATETDDDAGEALLAFAADNSIDLIVMGAYGHSRFREILLGGATRTVLRASPLPLWMTH